MNDFSSSITGAWPEPLRLAEAAARLVGGPLDAEHIQAVAEAVEEEVAPQGDFLGSAEYRRAMLYLRSAGLRLLQRIERIGADVARHPPRLGAGYRLGLLLRARLTVLKGDIRSLADLETVTRLSQGRIDLTIGSALDIFGGTGVRYADAVAFNRRGL